VYETKLDCFTNMASRLPRHNTCYYGVKLYNVHYSETWSYCSCVGQCCRLSLKVTSSWVFVKLCRQDEMSLWLVAGLLWHARCLWSCPGSRSLTQYFLMFSWTKRAISDCQIIGMGKISNTFLETSVRSAPKIFRLGLSWAKILSQTWHKVCKLFNFTAFLISYCIQIN
jgi:hypothetical protein